MRRKSLNNRTPAKHRRGAITVLSAALSIVILGLVAFAVDVGYVLSNKQELQRAADAAAMAACWDYAQKLSQGCSSSDAITSGRATATSYASQNRVGGVNPLINQNAANSSSGDLVFGTIADLYDPNATMSTSNPNAYNAVRIKIRRDSTLNGEAPYFFARVFGRTGQGLDAEATAGFMRGISGFRTPGSGGNVMVLPYALDEDTWDELLSINVSILGVLQLTVNCTDNWTWNAETKTITAGPDGIPEVNLFPQGTGSPGNRGTIDIGGSNNSTSDIARQIVQGISPADLEHHGGALEFDENGELDLNGDTGISAGVKDELTSIKGQPRMIPIFSEVCGPGNNAQYTIVRWAGIRIMDVKLTGSMSQKRVIVQPAPLVVPGAIASGEESSDYVYTPIVLVK